MAKINTLNYQTVASWNGSQDLFVVEQPDGTKVATPAMVKQYVLGNSIDDIYSVMGQNGAKNLIPYPYYNESGYSNQGMTITYDADGVFTINKVAGTATAYYRIATLNFLKPSTKYRLVFEVENATSISLFLQKPTTGDYVTINNKSSGIFVAEFETTADSQISSRAIGLSCTASDTETNATVKVMLVYASDTDNTYQPYAKTNKQLTEVIGDLSQTGLTGDSAADQLADIAANLIIRSAGSSITVTMPVVWGYFYPDQYTAKVPIPTIAPNTNYTITLVGVKADNVPATVDILTGAEVVSKNNTYFEMRTPRNLSSYALPNPTSCRIGMVRYTITFA